MTKRLKYTTSMESSVLVDKLLEKLLRGKLSDYDKFEVFMGYHWTLTFLHQNWIAKRKFYLLF